MERALGRPLHTDEHVHHINEDKFDNRLENLELLSLAEHASLHSRGPRPWAKGVSKRKGGWLGYAQVDGRQRFGPTRSTREEALADRQRMLDGAT
jgi:hypothetical protein